MPLGGAAAMAVVCLAGGIITLNAAKKNGKRTVKGIAAALFLLFAAFTVYLLAAYLMLGGIK